MDTQATLTFASEGALFAGVLKPKRGSLSSSSSSSSNRRDTLWDDFLLRGQTKHFYRIMIYCFSHYLSTLTDHRFTNLDSFVAANKSSSSTNRPSFVVLWHWVSLEGALTLDFIPPGFTSGLSLLGFELIHWSWYTDKQMLCHVMWYQHASSIKQNKNANKINDNFVTLYFKVQFWLLTNH